ncbi:hypothetical protein CDAR_392271 [Caerostris darwini]|uniref:Uncharacterized protein n=1 Tax=Caerostris darwini TaxID=1538125 RepID=A0AAV4SLS7_9ARAC|nr:hypothetical protein CDAR_392271 [Caerostris darwini]
MRRGTATLRFRKVASERPSCPITLLIFSSSGQTRLTSRETLILKSSAATIHWICGSQKRGNSEFGGKKGDSEGWEKNQKEKGTKKKNFHQLGIFVDDGSLVKSGSYPKRTPLLGRCDRC